MNRYWCLILAVASATAAYAAAPRLRYRIETVAGSSRMGDGGPATAAQIGTIQGIAADRWGNLYLADTDNHRVRRVDPNGIIVTVAGGGAPGFSGDGGPALEAQLCLPYGLAVDRNGALYIADLGNNRVRRVGPDGVISTVAGNGLRGSGDDGAAASGSPLLTPRNVAVDAAGTLYFSEFEGHRVRKLSADGRLITVAGTGVAGFRGDDGAAGAAQLSYPAGLAFDAAGWLYIADSGNQRVRRVGPGGRISTVLGGTAGTALLVPTALGIGPGGTILVADGTAVVRAYTVEGAWGHFAGTGLRGFGGDGGPASAARLNVPRDILASSSGAVYIADGSRVRVVDAAGVIRTLAGDGYLRAIGDGGAATAAQLYRPVAMALNAAGSLFIADAGTERIRQVEPGGTISTLAGTGVAGFSEEPAAAAASPLYAPMGVAVDAAGNVLIADSYNHRIRQVGPDGSISTVAGTGASGTGREDAAPLETILRGPRGICLDHAGVLYIVDTANHRVLRAAQGANVRTAAGNGSPGSAGDGGNARLAQLNEPNACAVDAAGNLYIADTANHRIRKVLPDGSIVTAAGMGGQGFGGDEGPAAAALLDAPRGVAVDGDGNLFIADTGNNRIRMVTPDGVIRTVAGKGVPGFAVEDGPADAAHLNAPTGLLLDGSGRLYIADTNNNRIRRLKADGEELSDPVIAPAAVSVVNAASLRPGAVAPGEIVSIFGSGLGPENGAAGGYGPDGLLVRQVAGVEARFNGVSAPLLYVQSGQINAQVPYEIAGSEVARIEIYFQGRLCASAEVPFTAAAPALFSTALNQDGSVNSESSRAARGQIVVLYATGEGLMDGRNVTGQPSEAPYAKPRAPVGVTIAGIQVEILYAGAAPGLVGLMQVNARVPGGFLPPGQAQVQLTVGPAVSPEIPIFLK